MSKIFRKLIRAVEVILVYRNWMQCFFCYMGRLLEPRVTYVLRNGIKFMASTKDVEVIPAINDVWLRKVYLHQLISIRKGFTVIDIGANIGSFTIFASTRAKEIKVFSYEPYKENFNFLIQNIKINELNNVIPFQLAVSDKNEKIKLYIDEKRCTGHSTVVPSEMYEDVNSITLDDILLLNEIVYCDLLKMDCEGAEYKIIYGASKDTLSKIGNITMEYHDVVDNNIDELKLYLENEGFKITMGNPKFLYASRFVT